MSKSDGLKYDNEGNLIYTGLSPLSEESDKVTDDDSPIDPQGEDPKTR